MHIYIYKCLYCIYTIYLQMICIFLSYFASQNYVPQVRSRSGSPNFGRWGHPNAEKTPSKTAVFSAVKRRELLCRITVIQPENVLQIYLLQEMCEL